MSEQRLWTLQISGPNPFGFHLPGNPSVGHEGGTSVSHLYLTEVELKNVRGLVRIHGNKLKAWPMAGRTDEQAEEQWGLNSLAHLEEADWPCVGCPTCPWFTPLTTASPCGIFSHPPESVQTLRENSESHRKAERSCPVNRGVTHLSTVLPRQGDKT